MAVLVILLSAPPARADEPEQVCTIGELETESATIACYSDAGCQHAETLGSEPVRDYDTESAPYALARGKIAAVITSSTPLMAKIKSLGGACQPY